MRWQVLQEGRIYVRQNLEEDELSVAEIQEKIMTGDIHMANRIMQFGERFKTILE